MTAQPALPEIAEQDAHGATASRFADIRGTTQRPVVNLLFRTLAAEAGALDWAWQILRPGYRSGRIDRAGAQLAISESYAGVQIEPASDLRASVPLDANALDAIRMIFLHYNASNRATIIAVSILTLALEQPVQLKAPAPCEEPIVVPQYTLPPLLTVARMPADLRNLVIRLSGGTDKGTTPIIPGIYRHLAHWPAFLEFAAIWLAPLLENGTIEREVAKLLTQANVHAASLVEPAPDKGAGQTNPRGVRAITAQFRQIVAKMLVIGLLLETTLPPEAT